MITTKRQRHTAGWPSDGPLGRAGECGECGCYKESDIFSYHGSVLCGNCRYFVRNGTWPHRTPTQGAAAWSNADDHDAFNGSPAVCSRELEFDVSSQYEAAFLDNWLDVCQLSLQ